MIIPVTYLCWSCGSSETVMEDIDIWPPVLAVEQWNICPECIRVAKVKELNK